MERVGLRLGEGQTVLPAELIVILLGLLHLTRGLMKLPPGLEVHRVHDDVVVYVRRVHVRDDHALIALEVFRELQTDLMRGLEVQRIVGGEGLDDVIVTAPVRFAELFFHRFELGLRSLGNTVDAGDETAHGFLPVGDVVEYAAQTA